MDFRFDAAIESPGLAVYVAAAAKGLAGIYGLGADRGVALGTLFQRGSDTRCQSLSHADVLKVRTSGFEHLLRNFWGNYVAIARDDASRATRVLRDPSGLVHCFVAVISGVHVIASHVEDFDRLNIPLTVNWSYVAATLVRQSPPHTLQTGIKEVSSVLPGQCLEISATGARRVSPWLATQIAADSLNDPDEARRQMHSEICNAVRAWSSCHDNVLLMLSGGLDSSVVATCLRDSPSRPNVTCLNLYYPKPGNDERRYARNAGQFFGFEVVHKETSFATRIEPLLTLPKSERPGTNTSSYVLWGRSVNAIAQQLGASAIFFGMMGDQLFCQQAGDWAAADYAYAHGLSPRLVAVALDTACRRHHSLWTTLRDAAKSRFNGAARERILSGAYRLENIPTFLSRQTPERAEPDMLRPWPGDEPPIPVGKLLQCSALTYTPAQYLPPWSGDYPTWAWPLHSQPVIELCLRIPLHVHIQHGWDRSIARQAFADRLPPDVLTRLSKGWNVVRHDALFEENIGLIRELLLDGYLAKEGMLDRAVVEKALSGEQIAQTTVGLDCPLLVETWLRTLLDTSSVCISRSAKEAAN